MSNYGENICVAIDQIVSKKLEGLAYDITKLCTIVDDSEKQIGKYIVSDGATKFEAYSTDNNLREGNSVLVNIPNGDFNMQKTILGKQTSINTQPFKYTAPLDTMVKISDSALLFNTETKLIANCNGANSGKSIKKIVTFEGDQVGAFYGFTRFGISADFKAWLAPYDTTEGIYGLKITITAVDSNQADKKAQLVDYEMTLSSEDMTGNPYNFETYFSQEKVFDISFMQKIQKIKIEFYQNGQFKDGNGKLIPYQNIQTMDNGVEIKEIFQPNIFVNNINCYLGYDVNDFSEDTLMLVTPDSLEYTNESGLQKQISQYKDMYVRWIHREEDGSFILKTSLEDNMHLYWYKYKLGAIAADAYGGSHWEKLDKYSSFSISDYKLNIEEATNEFKVIIVEEKDENQVIYRSNLLTFTNLGEVENKISVDVMSAFSIAFNDGSNGNYLLYNQNGKLIDDSQGSTKIRTLELYYKGTPVSINTEITKNIQSITWRIPYQDNENSSLGTMVFFKNDYVGLSGTGSITQTERIWTNKVYVPIKYSKGAGYTQQYGIKNFWSPGYSNNTITCEVLMNNIKYNAVAELTFGKAGTTGTNVTFALDFEDGINAINLSALSQAQTEIVATSEDQKVALMKEDEVNKELLATRSGEKSNVTVKARLYDAAGMEIDIQNYTIEWGWLNADTANSNYKQYLACSSNAKTPTIATISLNQSLTSVPKNNYNILQATLKNWASDQGTYDLIAYLPIPIKQGSQQGYISGAKEVIYNLEGKPSYYKGYYLLYDNKNEVVEVTWGLNPTFNNSEKAFNLSLTSQNKKYSTLVAPEIYLKDSMKYNCIYCEKNGVVLWSQPILVTQNQYEFAMLNSWDGKLTINENNGTILSTMIGAGKKESNNTFTGVLLGNIGASGNNVIGNTGVYGLKSGAITYALKDDGTATFGASGKGQIKIDGNGGTITSGGYDINKKTGMKIDLEEGSIDAYNFKLTSSLITLNSDGNTNNPYLKITDDTGNPLIKIASQDYILQSSEENTKLDLKTGVFRSSKTNAGTVLINPASDPFFSVSNSANKNLLYIGDNNYYLQSSNYDGTIHKHGTYDNKNFKVYSIQGKSGYYTVIVDNNKENFYSLTRCIDLDTNLGTVSITGWTEFITDKTYPNESYEEVNEKGEKEQKLMTVNQLRKKYKSLLKPVLTKNSPKGLKIDLNTGIISGYDLYLKGTAINDSTKTFILDSSAPTTPLRIGEKFKVDWDGSLTCDNITYLGTTEKKGDWVININDTFKVNSSGGGYAGNFGCGWASNALSIDGYTEQTVRSLSNLMITRNGQYVNISYDVTSMTVLAKNILAFSVQGGLTNIENLPIQHHTHNYYYRDPSWEYASTATTFNTNP